MLLLRLCLLLLPAAALVHRAPCLRPAARLCARPAGAGEGFGEKKLKKKAPVLIDDLEAAAEDSAPPSNSELLTKLLSEEQDKAAERRDRVEDLAERDAYVAEKGVEAARVPDEVANRMIARMAIFGGTPVFLGIGVFVWFYFQATGEDNVFQPTAVAAATTVPWVIGLLGIGFGALSASWDEDVEGSALGAAELKLNVGRLLEGVSRSAEDAQLRETEARRKPKKK
mmetsp:Transcript_12655/g.37630  ORF Transcript_12655/g.37630 Transcript_12655/m.37630 type:complete len:227 (+) Transcript_12655:120-800(+)